MEERRREEFKDGDIPAPVSIKFSEKFENFWYHYKWHTIFAAVIIAIVTICTLQMCGKESYDIHILYAGPHEIKKSAEGADTPEYAKAVSSLRRVTEDINGDGEVSLSLKDLFLLNEEQIKEVESDTGLDVNYTLISENSQIFKDTVIYSEYFLCFLSPEMYEIYKMIDDVYIFSDVSEYAAQYGAEAFDSSAIYLSSTEFYTLPGISDLPEDTLICVRNISPLASHWDKEGSEEDFAAAIAVLKNILDYKA